jgi:hypothetical protein
MNCLIVALFRLSLSSFMSLSSPTPLPLYRHVFFLLPPPSVAPYWCNHCCHPSSIARRHRHLSPPSHMQQCLIVVSLLLLSSLSPFDHHIVFAVDVMLHIIIIASPSHPLSYWLDHIVQSLTLVDCCFSGVVIAVGPFSLSRQVTGAHCP